MVWSEKLAESLVREKQVEVGGLRLFLNHFHTTSPLEETVLKPDRSFVERLGLVNTTNTP